MHGEGNDCGLHRRRKQPADSQALPIDDSEAEMHDRHEPDDAECPRVVDAEELGGQRKRKKSDVDRAGCDAQCREPRLVTPVDATEGQDTGEIDREPPVVQAFDAPTEERKRGDGEVCVPLVVGGKEHATVRCWLESRRLRQCLVRDFGVGTNEHFGDIPEDDVAASAEIPLRDGVGQRVVRVASAQRRRHAETLAAPVRRCRSGDCQCHHERASGGPPRVAAWRLRHESTTRNRGGAGPEGGPSGSVDFDDVASADDPLFAPFRSSSAFNPSR